MNPTQPATAPVGRNWHAQLLGKRSINGKDYTITTQGNVEEVAFPPTIYEIAHTLIDHLEADNREMQHPEAIIIKICPAGVTLPPLRQPKSDG